MPDFLSRAAGLHSIGSRAFGSVAITSRVAAPTFAGMAPFPLGTPIGALGSSSIQHHNVGVDDTLKELGQSIRGELHWARNRLKNFRFRNTFNASDPLARNYSGDNSGLSGDDALAIRARVASVAGYRAVLLYSGSNDLLVHTPASDIAPIVDATISDIFAQDTDIVFLRLVHPRGTAGASGQPDTGAPYWANRIALNNLLRSMASSRVVIIDPTPHLMIPGSPIEEAMTDVLADGLHLNGRGAYLASKAWDAKIEQRFEPGRYWQPNLISGNLIANASFASPTGGVLGSNATGVVPTNFRVGRNSGGGSGAVSLVDGLINLALPTEAGSWRVNPSTNPSTSVSGSVVSGIDGQWVQPSVRIKAKAGKESIGFFLCRVQAQTAAVGNGTFISQTLRPTVANTAETLFKVADADEDMHIVMDPFIIPAGTTHLFFEVLTSKVAGVEAVVQVGEFDIRVVSAPT